MLYLIGLGLGDAKDITVKGLEIVKQATRVYLEGYTSLLTCGKEDLENFYGREIIIADREMVESDSEQIFEDAKTNDVAFLVVGDPFGATTHSDLLLRANAAGIKWKVVHNASILNAIGCCGLQLYNFGETVSVCFWTDTWQPDSYYEKIVANRKRGLHTLCLLDIKVKEQSIENMMRGRKLFEPPRFMSCSEAASQLIQIANRKSGGDDIAFGVETLCVGVARVGSDAQKIVVCTLEDMAETDLGPPLHSLVIPGKLHPMECDILKLYAADPTTVDNYKECQ